MYSRDEVKKGKERFWTSFGQYLAVIPSADGDKINWINYKTGIKDVFFKMDADQYAATIMIQMANSDPELRHRQFETFRQYQAILEEILSEKWMWEEDVVDAHGKETSIIYTSITHVNLFNQQNWPRLISFFKPRIIGLDEFWSSAQYGFSIFK